MSLIDEIFDESELLSDEDKAALAAEERGETYEEPEPGGLAPLAEPPPEAIEKSREQNEAEQEAAWRLDERRRISQEIDAATSQQRAPEPPTRLGERPDPEYDPIGADLYDVRREQELLSMRLEEQQRFAQQRDFSAWVDSDAAQFRSQYPDYDQATAHAYAFRVDYWQRLGLSETKARAIVDQEAVATAQIARQNGKSAADIFYALAQQVGYQPRGAQQPARGAPVRQRQSTPRGKAPARAAVDVDALTEAQLEGALRRNPRATGITRALERRALLDR